MRGGPFRVALRRPGWPLCALAAWIVLVVVIDVVWLHRLRSSAPPEYDEAGYLAIALRDLHGLQDAGLSGLVEAFTDQHANAPLVPLLEGLVLSLTGFTATSTVIVQVVCAAGLGVVTYGLARHVVDGPWAALAGGLTVALPVVSMYSRIFHFAVPAALCLTTAAWLVAASDGLRRRWLAVGAGATLGLMTLTRTMTIAYLPGIGVAALLVALRGEDARRSRLTSFALFVGATALVGAPWYIGSYATVRAYLFGFGYGEASASYGQAYAFPSLDFFLKEARVVAADMQLAAFAAVALGVVGGLLRLAHARTRRCPHSMALADPHPRRRRRRRVRRVDELEKRRDCVLAALASIPRHRCRRGGRCDAVRAMRVTVAVALCLASAVSLGIQSGVSPTLARPWTVALPLLDRVAVTDGRWPQREDVAGEGFHLPPVTDPLPPIHRRWMPFMEQEIVAVRGYLRDGRLIIATGSVLLSTTRFSLAAQLVARQAFQFQRVADAHDRDATRELLEASPGATLVTAAPSPNGSGIDQSVIVSAAEASGFRAFRTSRAPDGRLVTWWTRASSGSQ